MPPRTPGRVVQFVTRFVAPAQVTCLGLEVWGGAKLLHVDIARRLRNGQNPLYQ